MALQNSLGLKLPERTTAPAGSILLNPKDVAAWTATLPMANVGETSRQVFKTLVEFNRLEIPNLSRIKTTELFRRPIAYISHNLQKRFLDEAFPLSAKNRKIAVLNRELYTELALAYKIFIENMMSGKSGKLDPKLLTIAIHRALSYMGQIIHQAVVVYDPIPTNVWQEMHRLYAFAERNKIHNLPVNEGEERATTSTIAERYKQALLFFVSSPYRMRQRQIVQIIGMLSSWSQQVTLTASVPGELSDYQFVVDLNSDAPPLHQTLERAGPTPQHRILTTEPLVKSLRESLDMSATATDRNDLQSHPDRLSGNLLGQLIAALSSAPRREFVRTQLSFELKTAVGINAINALLGKGAEQAPGVSSPHATDSELDWFKEPEAAFCETSAGTERRTLTLENAELTIDEDIIARSIYGGDEGQAVIPGWATERQAGQVDTFSCKTLNESAGGYCISWQGVDAPKVKVGEVIGIQSASDKGQFAIGISRWIRSVPGQGLLLGLSMIAPTSEAVLVQHMGGTSFSDQAQKGLLIPEMKAPNRPASLILPALPYKPGDRVLLIRGNLERKAKLTHLLDQTGAFAQFEFSYLGSQPFGSDDSANSTAGDFDKVRSIL